MKYVKTIDYFKDVFNPYPHQKEFLKAFFSNQYNYFMLCWHRRCGKDASAFHATFLYASLVPGNYLYLLPKIGQARNVIWQGKDLKGGRWIDALPNGIISGKHETECKLTLSNGSIIHITGADNLANAHLGSNIKGVVLSEFQAITPAVWDVTLRPIIRRSQGWVVFAYTALGKGHAYKLFQQNKSRGPYGWFCQKLTVEDTYDNDGRRIITAEDIEEERASGLDENLLQQEYYCNEEAAITGAYFNRQMDDVDKEGRIISYKVDPLLPVHTAWDLGSRDTNSIWFFQYFKGRFYFFYQQNNHYESIQTYANELLKIQQKHNFKSYGHHFMPHDVAQTEWGSGMTRAVQLMQEGIRPHAVKRLRVVERVQAARRYLPYCHFDRVGCEHGIDALRIYRPKIDAKTQQIISDELHDWSSHPASAFTYAFVGWVEKYNDNKPGKVHSYQRNKR